MEEIRLNNSAILRGVPTQPPRFSHESRGERFYQFPMEIRRLSGVSDIVNILTREDLVDALEPNGEDKLFVSGELRSFNNKGSSGPRLIISVFAKELKFESGADENIIELSGTICKTPNLRVTPMGREICDMMLAVNRRYGRSDYLPCICWGVRAREASLWQVGDTVALNGRIQSRRYTKVLDGETLEKTAYEVSVIDIKLTDSDT